MKNSATNSATAMFVKQIFSVLRSTARAKSMAIKNKTNALRARLTVFSLLRNKKLSLGAISGKIHSFLASAAGPPEELRQYNDVDDHHSKAIVLYKATAGPTGTDDDQRPVPSSSSRAAILQQQVINSSMPHVDFGLIMQDDIDSSSASCINRRRDDQHYYCYYYGHDHSADKLDDDDKYPDLTHSLFEEEDELDLLAAGDLNASVVDLVRNSRLDGGGQNFRLEDEIDHVADLFIMKFHKNMRMQKLESFKRYQEMLERSA